MSRAFPVTGVASGAEAAARPVRIIFDTDMGNDIDDALALALIHALESRGEARLLGVTVSKDNPWSPVFVDMVNTFYGRGRLPLGVVKEGIAHDDLFHVEELAGMVRADGLPAFPRRWRHGQEAPDAVGLLRRILAGEADAGVTLVQVGFSTNLARLLDTVGDDHCALSGRELVARKVRLLSVMAGDFTGQRAEFNVVCDVPSARKLFDEWPGPIVVGDFEVGLSIRYPAASIERDFRWVDHHPVAEAYRRFMPMPYDRPTWDLTSVLFAVRPRDGYFGLSGNGRVIVHDDGKTSFISEETGRHRYLTVTPQQRARILEAFIDLASPPGDDISGQARDLAK